MKFGLSRDFFTMHLLTKFCHPMFNHSEVIAWINEQTNKQTNKQRFCRQYPPHSAMLCWWKNVLNTWTKPKCSFSYYISKPTYIMCLLKCTYTNADNLQQKLQKPTQTRPKITFTVITSGAEHDIFAYMSKQVSKKCRNKVRKYIYYQYCLLTWCQSSELVLNHCKVNQIKSIHTIFAWEMWLIRHKTLCIICILQVSECKNHITLHLQIQCIAQHY